MVRKVLVLTLAGLFAVTGITLAFNVPDYNGRQVNDLAGVLTQQNINSLESLLASHERETSNQVAILIVPSLGGETVANCASQVFNTWGLGQKGKNNGVLILISVLDRKVRITVGRGLKQVLSEEICSDIIKTGFVPSLKSNDYAGGLSAMTEKILMSMRGTYQVEATDIVQRSNISNAENSAAFVMLLVLCFVVAIIVKVAAGGVWAGFSGGIGASCVAGNFGASAEEVVGIFVVGFIVGALSTEIIENLGNGDFVVSTGGGNTTTSSFECGGGSTDGSGSDSDF